MTILSKPEGQNTVLIVAYYFPPQNASGAQRPYRFFKYLPEYGYSPAVVCCGPGVGAVTTMARFVGLAERAAGIAGYRFQWVPDAIQESEMVIRCNPIQCVISTCPPLAAHLVGQHLHRTRRIKWIADFRDPLYDPHDPHARYRYVGRWSEKAIMHRADAILANTEPSLENFRALYPNSADRMSAIWNGYDPDEPAPSASAPPRSFRVMAHVGDIYSHRHPGLLVHSISRLMAKGRLSKNDLRVQFVGPMDDLPSGCNDKFDELERAGVVEANRALVPRLEANRIAAEADYLLLLDLTAREVSIQTPAKLFDYIRIGKPILAFTTPRSATEWILSRSGIPHVCVYVNDHEDVVDRKIEKFLLLAPESTPASEEFAQLFNGKHQTRALADLIRSL